MQRCPLKSNTGLSAGSGSGGVAASACTTLKKANSRVTRLRATPTLFARGEGELPVLGDGDSNLFSSALSLYLVRSSLFSRFWLSCNFLYNSFSKNSLLKVITV